MSEPVTTRAALSAGPAVTPLTIRMQEQDNVVIVANDGGLPAGTPLTGGPVLLERVPQAHKVALVTIAAGAPVVRYGVPIGYALKDIPAGSWVHERLLSMPDARGLDDLPKATSQTAELPPPSKATPSRATAMPMARWAHATSWPSPRPCNVWPV